MPEQIKITGFYIVSPGDPSVGLFRAEWKLTGDEFWFEDQQQLDIFKEQLHIAFEEVADDNYVQTFEEYEEELRKENELFKDQVE